MSLSTQNPIPNLLIKLQLGPIGILLQTESHGPCSCAPLSTKLYRTISTQTLRLHGARTELHAR